MGWRFIVPWQNHKKFASRICGLGTKLFQGETCSWTGDVACVFHCEPWGRLVRCLVCPFVCPAPHHVCLACTMCLSATHVNITPPHMFRIIVPYQKCVFRQGFCGWQHVYYMISRYFPMFALPPHPYPIWVFPKIGIPQNGWWKIMEIPWNPYKNGMICRYHYFRKPPYINNQFNIYIFTATFTSPWGRGHANFSRQHESRWREQRIVRKATPPKKTNQDIGGWGIILFLGPKRVFFDENSNWALFWIILISNFTVQLTNSGPGMILCLPRCALIFNNCSQEIERWLASENLTISFSSFSVTRVERKRIVLRKCNLVQDCIAFKCFFTESNGPLLLRTRD